MVECCTRALLFTGSLPVGHAIVPIQKAPAVLDKDRFNIAAGIEIIARSVARCWLWVSLVLFGLPITNDFEYLLDFVMGKWCELIGATM